VAYQLPKKLAEARQMLDEVVVEIGAFTKSTQVCFIISDKKSRSD